MPVLLLFLTAGAIAAAVYLLRKGEKGKNLPPAPEEPDRRQLEGAAAALEEVLDALLAVMGHPQLGGPGFLEVQLPSPGEGGLVAEAQFPNIQEELYRRVARGQTDREELIRAGVPEALFRWQPAFAAESGGMVLLSVRLPGLAPELESLLESRQGRGRVLGALAEELGRRYPALSVRSLGRGLLLTPDRL